MATTTGPDLTVAREAVEALMDDTCVIRHDAPGAGDDTFNDVTGELTPPDPDSTTIYDDATTGDGGRDLGARCKVAPVSQATTTVEGGVSILTGTYNGSIPWDAPEPPVGAVLEITSSRRDPDLVGQEFTIIDVKFGTFLVSRKMTLELRR